MKAEFLEREHEILMIAAERGCSYDFAELIYETQKIENGLDDCPDLDNDKTTVEWPDFFNVDY